MCGNVILLLTFIFINNPEILNRGKMYFHLILVAIICPSHKLLSLYWRLITPCRSFVHQLYIINTHCRWSWLLECTLFTGLFFVFAFLIFTCPIENLTSLIPRLFCCKNIFITSQLTHLSLLILLILILP